MKLTPKNLSRSYELTYLLPVSYTEAELGKINQDLTAELEKLKVKDIKLSEWGKRDLAYPIKHKAQKLTEAHYYHLTFEAEPKAISQLEKSLGLNADLVRHLLVVASDDQPVQVEENQSAAEESDQA